MAEVLKIVIEDPGAERLGRPLVATAPATGGLRPNPDLDAAFGVKPPPAAAAQQTTAAAEEAGAGPPPVPAARVPVSRTTTAVPSATGSPTTTPFPSPVTAAAPRVVEYTPGIQPPVTARPVATSVAAETTERAAGGAATEVATGRAVTGAVGGGRAAADGAGATVVAAAIEKGFQVATKGAQVAGQVGTQLAANNAVAAFVTTTKAAADVMEKIPVVGTAVASAFQFAATAVTTFEQVTTAFVNRGRELAQYDARLAEAAAKADVQRLQADLREANTAGEQLARLIEKQADLEVLLRELILPIKVVIVDFLVDAIKFLMEMAQYVPWIGGYAREALEKLKADKSKAADGLVQNWLQVLDSLGPDPRPLADPVGDAAIRERLNRPMGDVI